jgi:tetratricopeptide (TPR) repeat protein
MNIRPLNPVRRFTAMAALSGALVGCAGIPTTATNSSTDPPQDLVPAPTVVLPPEPSAYELRQRERATALAQQGKLAEAALIWDTLATIRPKVPEYRERWTELQRQIETSVAERLQRADQAASRGQLDAAIQQYLAALALQPDNSRAATALRGVERERNKRNYLGKLSRNTLTRKAMAEAEVESSGSDDGKQGAATTASLAPRTDASGAEDSNDMEHASLLASQGEWDEAISLLERRLKTNRRDDAARTLLADVYFQKAESLGPRNRSAAIALLERSVRTDPSNTRAAERLKQLRPVAVANPSAAAAPAAAASGAAARPATAQGNAGAQANSAIKPAAATVVSPAASAAPPRR